MTLSVTRKSDRAKMAAMLLNIAKECGANAESHEHDRIMDITAELNGVRVLIGIFGNIKDSHCLSHWNSTRRFAPEFAFTINGDLNQYHGCKATGYASNFDSMCTLVRDGLNAARDGSALAAP